MTLLDALLVVNLLGWGVTVVACHRARSRLGWWSAAACGVVSLALTPFVATAMALGTVVATGSLLSLPTGVPSRRRWSVLGLVGAVAAAGLWIVPLRGVALGAGISCGVLGAVRSIQRSTPQGRRRIEAVLIAVVAAVELALGLVVAAVLLGWTAWTAEIFLAAGLALPASTLLAISPRVSSWVERTLNVVVVGGGLLALATGVVVVVLAGLGGRPQGHQREAVVISLLAAGVAAVVQPSLAGRLRTAANRLVYGTVDSPDDVARAFGARLSRAVPLDELLLQLAETLRRALRLEAAEVWTGSEGRHHLAAAVPHVTARPLSMRPEEVDVVLRSGPSGGSWVELWVPELARRHEPSRSRIAPLAHAGRLLGLVAVRRPVDADPFDERDDQVLADLTRQMGAALYNVELDNALAASVEELRRTNDELRASRARVVASGDAERRRIERDLHDGAQQHLVALAVKLRLAADSLADGDAADATVLLDEMRGDLTDTIAELRSLAHGIYPPLLASGGLAEALPAAAARAALPATVERCPLGRYPPEIETAVYFCCLEALQNAAKHAGPGATVRIEAEEGDGVLVFVIRDDGAGFEPGSRAGQGLSNMTDRIGAVGGTLEVHSEAGTGTRLCGRLPLPDDRVTGEPSTRDAGASNGSDLQRLR
jgi:signal transduction histidine kinase